MEESPLERLAKTHPDLEIWWDSSPLVYPQWVRKMLNCADPAHKPVLEEQLARLYHQPLSFLAGHPKRSKFLE